MGQESEIVWAKRTIERLRSDVEQWLRIANSHKDENGELVSEIRRLQAALAAAERERDEARAAPAAIVVEWKRSGGPVLHVFGDAEQATQLWASSSKYERITPGEWHWHPAEHHEPAEAGKGDEMIGFSETMGMMAEIDNLKAALARAVEERDELLLARERGDVQADREHDLEGYTARVRKGRTSVLEAYDRQFSKMKDRWRQAERERDEARAALAAAERERDKAMAEADWLRGHNAKLASACKLAEEERDEARAALMAWHQAQAEIGRVENERAHH